VLGVRNNAWVNKKIDTCFFVPLLTLFYERNEKMLKILKSEFSKNIITLLSGTVIAQAIPIAVMPILSRIYAPEDFGILAVFVSFTSVIGAIANARYEMAIVLPKEERDALALVLLGASIAFVFSVVFLAVVVVWGDFIAQLTKTPAIAPWLYFIPFSIFFIGLFNVLNYYNTRTKHFKIIARANVFKTLGLSVVNIFVGLLKQGPLGLILGQVFSFFFGNYRLSKTVLEQKETIKSLQIEDLKRVAKRYRNFPQLSMPSIFANVLSVNLTNLFTTTLFDIRTLGFYSMANRILGIPTVFIGQAFGQVYMQEASSSRQKTGEAYKIFKSTLIKLVLISLPVFVLLYFFSEELFVLFLGEKWRVAGVYARVLVPLFWMRFITAPLSLTNIVFEKQKIALFWQLGLLLLTLIIFLVVYYEHYSFFSFMYLYVIVLALYYVFLLVIVNNVAKGK